MEWDDPELDDIVRGIYRKRLMYPSEVSWLRIMELGCGLGWLTLEFARQGHNVDSCDISEKRVQFADSYYKHIKKNEKGVGNIHYFKGDLNRIDLPENTYDLVVCWDSLHHVINMERPAKQIYGSLKKGGRFIAYDEIGNYSQIVALINSIMFSMVALIFEPSTLLSLLCGKIKKCFARNPHRCSAFEETMLGSPCDGATGKEMIDLIVNIFGENQVRYETAAAFGPMWLPRIRGPKSIRLGIASLVMKIDRFLIRKRLVKGASAYIEAIKA